MNYGLGRRISFHEEVEIVPIQDFSSTALVEPFEEDTCSREYIPRDASLIIGHHKLTTGFDRIAKGLTWI